MKLKNILVAYLEVVSKGRGCAFLQTNYTSFSNFFINDFMNNLGK